MKKIGFLSILLFLFSLTYAQDGKDGAKQLAEKGANKIRFEEYKDGIKLYKKALKIDKKNIDYKYNIAYGYYMLGKGKKAWKIIDPVLKENTNLKDYHAFLANLYESLGKEYNIKPKEVIVKGPSSAKEYAHEAMQMINSDPAKARLYFDHAINLQPDEAEYYYQAAKLYAGTVERMWTLIYGEIFVNLEKTTERTLEIKKLMMDTWRNSITINTADEVSVELTQEKATYGLDKFDEKKFVVNFAESYETTLEIGLYRLEDGLSLTNMYFYYQDFVNYWFRKKELEYPCFIFEWEKTISESDHLEAYIFWLFKDSFPAEYNDWIKIFSKQMASFESWFANNQMNITEYNRVNGVKY
ncbi:MAG: tetratricopeptide repeat protein [Bacteroidetes bacterium]|nr:tetratricopeptide repeat protein [Bacteroidota bacterium]